MDNLPVGNQEGVRLVRSNPLPKLFHFHGIFKKNEIKSAKWTPTPLFIYETPFPEILDLPLSSSYSVCWRPKLTLKSECNVYSTDLPLLRNISSFLASRDFVVCWLTLQKVWTKIRTDRMLVLIWIQTIWHFDSVPESNFEKSQKTSEASKITQHAKSLAKNYLACKELGKKLIEFAELVSVKAVS